MAFFGIGPAPRDLRSFLQLLKNEDNWRRISAPVDPDLELAAIADRVLAAGGPALLFENVIGSPMPVAVNTLGTVERVVWSMGLERPNSWRISDPVWRCCSSPGLPKV